MIPHFTVRARLALALAIALNRPWAWLTLADAYKAPPALNRAQRRADAARLRAIKPYKATPPI